MKEVGSRKGKGFGGSMFYVAKRHQRSKNNNKTRRESRECQLWGMKVECILFLFPFVLKKKNLFLQYKIEIYFNYNSFLHVEVI